MPRLNARPHARPPRGLRGASRLRPSEVVYDPARLGEVLEPGENVRQLYRPLTGPLQDAFESIDELPVFEIKRQVRSTADVAWLTELLDERKAQALLPDLERWFLALRALVHPGEAFEGSLLVTHGDDCRKYHVDWVRLRLLVTYHGVGTEWVGRAAVNRTALTKDWSSVSRINREIVPDARAVYRAGAGDVLLLKGETYPENRGNGAVHRSPPIAGEGSARLVFKLTLK